MTRYFFMPAVLRFIGDGGLFARIVGVTLRICALLVALLWAVSWFSGWVLIFHVGGLAVFAGLLAQLVNIVIGYMVVHTIWIRAADVEALKGSEFIVTPILSALVRLGGEVVACILAGTGAQLAVVALFSERLLRKLAPDFLAQGVFYLPGVGGFLWAILLGLGGAIAAVFCLLLFYLMAEWLVAVVDVARNTGILRKIAEQRGEVPVNP